MGLKATWYGLAYHDIMDDKIRPEWDWKEMPSGSATAFHAADKIRPEWDWKDPIDVLLSNPEEIKSDQNGIKILHDFHVKWWGGGPDKIRPECDIKRIY